MFNYHIRQWWDIKFLKQYLSEGLAPRGLGNKKRCGFLEPDLQSTWDKVSTLCTAQWMEIICMQRDRMLLVSQNKLSTLLKLFEIYHQVLSYQRCRDCLNAERASFEENLITSKRNKFARDIADYEKGTIIQWEEGRFKAHNVGGSQGSSNAIHVPPPPNKHNHPQQQPNKGGGPHKESNKAHARQQIPAHSTQRPGHIGTETNSRGRGFKKSNHNHNHNHNTSNPARGYSSRDQLPVPPSNCSPSGPKPRIPQHGPENNEPWVQYKDKRSKQTPKTKYGNKNNDNSKAFFFKYNFY